MVKLIKKIISSFFIETEIKSPFTKDLSGKVVLITGGTKGMGKAIGYVLVREGATVVTISRMGSKNKSFNLDHLNCDITKKSQIDSAVEKIIKKYEKIDVLINNAGLFLDKEMEEVSEKDFDSLVDTNLKGMFLMSKAVIPFMKKNKKGLIINIGSKISHNTNILPGKVLYAVTKFAVEGFSIALSRELKKYGIRVTCLMPGTINNFVSFKSKQFLSPHNLGFAVSMMIKAENVDFESIIIKSSSQII